ncbi:MAG: hypothetical protein U0V04_03365 [Spirosomataceae bacterium]|jgi:hypothetical protein
MELQNQKCLIYQSELDLMAKYIADSPRIETGGELFGYWSNKFEPVIQFVTGPGKNALHEVAFFRQDPEYLNVIGQVMYNEYGLFHIGTWHSHHRLGLEYPSNHDSFSMNNAVMTHDLSKFILMIGTYKKGVASVKGFAYPSTVYLEEVGFQLIKSKSPIRKQLEISHPDVIIPSKIKNKKMENFERVEAQNIAVFPTGSFLHSKAGRRKLFEITEVLKNENENVRILQSESNSEVYLSFGKSGKSYELVFPSAFPVAPPTLSIIHNGSRFPCKQDYWPDDPFVDTEKLVQKFITNSINLSRL